MHKFILTFAVLATISMSSLAIAQRPGGQEGARRGGGERGAGGQRGGPGGPGGQRGGRGGQRPVSPLMTALDADKDGKLSAEEIANAATALKSLDKNEDGVLESSELAPARGGGQRGGPGGGRGGFGDPSAMVDRFMERDADKDGKLSKEEAGDRMAQMFDSQDGNKDGFLDKTEIETMVKSWTGGGRGGRGGYGGGPKSKENRPAFDDN